MIKTMNRITTIIAMLLVMTGQAQAATSYKIKVADVAVTSSNATNITSSLIQAYDPSVNGGKPSVTYTGDATRGTLTLYNVKIERSGTYNRAILNEGNPGLVIEFKGENYLSAEDASPVRLEANTYITCTNGGKATIVGDDQDALCPYNSSTVTISNADLTIRALNSSAIEGGTNSSNRGSVVIYNSKVESYGSTASIRNIKSLRVQGDSDVRLTMRTTNVTVQNLANFYLDEPMALTYPNGVYFNASLKTFCTSSHPEGQPSTIRMKTTSPEINNTNFPDEIFRSYVSFNFDQNKNGYLSVSERDMVDEVDISNMGISNLKGLEFFPNLRILYCSYNQITTLDLTPFSELAYLDCSDNPLANLNLSNNLELIYLNCIGDNKLKNLYLSKCTKLQRLYCAYMELGSLDLSKNTALTILTCTGNQLTSLDLSKNTELNTLTCDDNQLTSLDLSNNKKLANLQCIGNQLTSLKVSSECTNLRYVYCHDNCLRGASMSELIGTLPTMTWGVLGAVSDDELPVTGNVITTAQVQMALSKGWQTRIHTTTGDYEDYAGLDLGIAIDETNFPDEYFRLYVSLNLDTDGNDYLSDTEIAAAKKIEGGMKNIYTLKGIEFFTELTELECYYNHLTELDLSKNTKLTYLDCSYNQLTKLDLSKNTLLNEVYIEDNYISNDNMTDFANKLPPTTDGFLSIYELNSLDEHNTINADQVAIMNTKGWTVWYFSGDYEVYGPIFDLKAEMYRQIDLYIQVIDGTMGQVVTRYPDTEAELYMSQLVQMSNQLQVIMAHIEAANTVELCNQAAEEISELHIKLLHLLPVVQKYLNGEPTGISDASRQTNKEGITNERDGETHNLSGQRVGRGYKGIVIVNGKKLINK